MNFWEKDAQVFHDQLQGARGLLFLTIAKMAMIGGLRVGTGLVIAKLPDGSWSAPCAVGTLGLSFGAMFGIGISDTVTALDDTAVTELADAHTTKISVGFDASLALGPLGRSASGEVLGASDASATTSTTYSQTRGFYGGISLNGANLRVRDDVNLKFYGKKVAPADVLRGRVSSRPRAQCLYEELGGFFGELEARRRRSAARQAYEYQSQRNSIFCGRRCCCSEQRRPLRLGGPRRASKHTPATHILICPGSSRRPPRHRRDACSIAWRCRFRYGTTTLNRSSTRNTSTKCGPSRA